MSSSPSPFCADTSRQAGEPLGATASRVDHWLLVEYPGRWARDPVAGSLVPPEVKEHFRGTRWRGFRTGACSSSAAPTGAPPRSVMSTSCAAGVRARRPSGER